MAPYVYKRNHEGIHIVNVGKTWEKLMIAARIIASIPNPKDVLVSHLSTIVEAGFLNLCSVLSIDMERKGRWTYRLCQAKSMPREPS